ncbi:DnaJ domain protein [Catovirus CTV1]|uniref:DnaJ domain protein n=1 Tax=Catovirus CTV1 TaxID=1977631 RepID=A0A1V0SBF8_9VIRU|nr:DnaJ domain protein [Catovirus CTV1]
MNPYYILNVNPGCSKDELRKAYLKLVLKYHPDRTNDPSAEEKIKEIYTAYELLKTDEFRQKYDNMENESKFEYYNEFRKYCNKKYPSLSKVIENIIQIFYEDGEEFKKDFNNFDFEKIYNTVTNKIPDLMANFDVPNNFEKEQSHELNIYGTIRSTLKNRYLNKYEKISVNRITKDPKILFIPLRESKVIFQNEGETYKCNHGDIVIDIIVEDVDGYTIIDNNLYTNVYITLYEYLYGGDLNFSHVDGEILNIGFKSMINDIPIITITDKGLPYCDDNNNILRGNLIVKLLIKDIDQISSKIKTIYD